MSTRGAVCCITCNVKTFRCVGRLRSISCVVGRCHEWPSAKRSPGWSTVRSRRAVTSTTSSTCAGFKRPSGVPFDLKVDAVIVLLNKPDPDEFYVQKPGLRVLLRAVAATSKKRAYVTTEPDGKPEDNLLSLPLCTR
jgi:hypothetical protein